MSESVGIRNMAQLAIFSLVCFSLATAMHFLRLTVLHSTLVVSSLMLLSCSSLSASVRLQVNGETMGTYFSVTIDSPSTSDTEASVRAEIVVRLNEINAQMSTWDSRSEISGFNRSDSTSWFPVSAEFAAVVQEAKRIHEISEGAFDPTVSPLIDLWGFGKPDRLGVPVQAAIENALKTVGMHKIDVRNRPPALRKSLPEVQLNLSAIAKGYAVDAIARLLIRSGRPSFIVDIGGETRAGIAKASGDPWRIGVESPKSGLGRNEQPAQVIPVTESSIATSGDYRNFYEADGATYSHTINPSTGRPLESPPASVSVIHNFCMTADALATAMMVLGRERGIQIAEQQGYSVLFQTAGFDGEIVQEGTGVFVKESSDTDSASESWVVFVAAGVLFLIAVGGMAIGILVSNRQIKGSCGGLASIPGSDGKSICDRCSIPREQCVNEELRQQLQAAGGGCEDEDKGSNSALVTHRDGTD